MKKMFPLMTDMPEDKKVVGGLLYWVLVFFAWSFIAQGFSMDLKRESAFWVDFAIHLINFVAILVMFIPYLKESFLSVQLYPKKVLSVVGQCVLIIVVVQILLLNHVPYHPESILYRAFSGSLITLEADYKFYATAFIAENPLWGVLYVVLMSPVTVSCLLYACAFAPLCNRRPILAYGVMTVALFLSRVSMAFVLWPFEDEMAIFLVQLPVHWIACWGYQQTDTVWTPIAIHTLSNLILSLVILF